jgi:integrase/recombinase XerD
MHESGAQAANRKDQYPLSRSRDTAMPERHPPVAACIFRNSARTPPAFNNAVAALRFFFTVTLDRPDLSRKLFGLAYPCKLPTVLSPE